MWCRICSGLLCFQCYRIARIAQQCSIRIPSVSGKYLLPLTSYEESRIITTGSHKASQSTFTSYNELRTYRIVRKISDMKYLDFIKQEMAVIMDRDPAIKSKMEVFLYPSFLLCKNVPSHTAYELSCTLTAPRN